MIAPPLPPRVYYIIFSRTQGAKNMISAAAVAASERLTRSAAAASSVMARQALELKRLRAPTTQRALMGGGRRGGAREPAAAAAAARAESLLPQAATAVSRALAAPADAAASPTDVEAEAEAGEAEARRVGFAVALEAVQEISECYADMKPKLRARRREADDAATAVRCAHHLSLSLYRRLHFACCVLILFAARARLQILTPSPDPPNSLPPKSTRSWRNCVPAVNTLLQWQACSPRRSERADSIYAWSPQ